MLPSAALDNKLTKALSLYRGLFVGRRGQSLKRVSEVFRVVMQQVCSPCPRQLPQSSAGLTFVDLVSFSGLTYLALWISAKFSIAIPMLAHWPKPPNRSSNPLETPSIRSQAAVPPTYLVAFPLFAVGLATYVSLTRYSDFWHHGLTSLLARYWALLLLGSAAGGFWILPDV